MAKLSEFLQDVHACLALACIMYRVNDMYWILERDPFWCGTLWIKKEELEKNKPIQECTFLPAGETDTHYWIHFPRTNKRLIDVMRNILMYLGYETKARTIWFERKGRKPLKKGESK